MGRSWARQLETTPGASPSQWAGLGTLKLSSIDQRQCQHPGVRLSLFPLSQAGDQLCLWKFSGEDFWLFVPMRFWVSGAVSPQDLWVSLHDYRSVWWGGFSKPSSELCGLPWCSFWCLAHPLSSGLPGVAGQQSDQDGGSGELVTQFSYLSRMSPDYVLFCSLDDDSDLYSPRYSFSEDSKLLRISWLWGWKGEWWTREGSPCFHPF